MYFIPGNSRLFLHFFTVFIVYIVFVHFDCNVISKSVHVILINIVLVTAVLGPVEAGVVLP